MRIFVISPIYPFRGGIAHSTRLLCEELSKHHDVTAVSFSRMYPEFLYPGKSQKEVDPDPTFSVQTEYVLDSLNPLTWLSLARRIRREQPDRVIFKWWHTFFTPMFWTIARFGRNPITKMVAICHNVLPHDQNRINEHLARKFFRHIDYFITHSNSDLSKIRSFMPGKPAAWITESTYETLLGAIPERRAAKERLGIEAESILFFGFIRPYKGLRYLLQAMPKILRDHPRLRLMVVGEFWSDKQEYLDLVRDLGIEANLVMVDAYVSNADVPLYFAAADAVVMPYLSSTESGIIQLAYGLNTPIITTAVGGNVDLIRDGVTGLLCEPANSEALAAAVSRFYAEELETRLKEGMRTNQDLFRWTAAKEAALLALPD